MNNPYSRGGPIILVAEPEYCRPDHFAGRNSGGREAVLRSSYELETIKHWTNIRTELPVRRVSRNKSLGNSHNHNDGSDYSIESYEENSSNFSPRLMLLASGLLFIFASILVPKAPVSTWKTVNPAP